MNDLLSLNVLKDALFDNWSSTQVFNYFFMLFLSLLYGIMLNVLYSIYYRESEPMDASLARSLILLTPTLMTIFWMIQFSLPLSVGLLGTLSFVRFRAPVKRAEDIAFIVIALACAISCALTKPMIGGMLVFIFLIYSLIRNYFLPRFLNGSNFAVLTYNTKKDMPIAKIENLFKKTKCHNFEFISSRTYDNITSYVFNISNLNKNRFTALTHALEECDKESNINIFYPNNRLGG